MLSKTRTTIIALVAAFSFAGASLVPTVAQALPGGNGKDTCYVWHQKANGHWGADFYFEGEKVAGPDGKWYTCKSGAWVADPRSGGSGTTRPEGEPKKAPESGSPPPTRPTPPPATTHA